MICRSRFCSSLCFYPRENKKKVITKKIIESVDQKSEEGIGNRLNFVLDDLKVCLTKIKELETSSEEHGKIGIETIRNSRKNLEQLRLNLEDQIEKLQNNTPEEQ